MGIYQDDNLDNYINIGNLHTLDRIDTGSVVVLTVQVKKTFNYTLHTTVLLS